jgi:hypothetical protein
MSLGKFNFVYLSKLKVMRNVEEIKLENKFKNAIKRIVGENQYNHEPTLEDFLVITRYQFRDTIPDMDRQDNILLFGYQATFN